MARARDRAVRGTRAARVRVRGAAAARAFNLLVAILAARGLTLRERIATLRWFARLQRAGYRCEPGQTVAAMTASLPRAVAESLWHPLCLAALNTLPAQASAQVFANVLRAVFDEGRNDARVMQVQTDLGALVADATATRLTTSGHRVALQAEACIADDRSSAGVAIDVHGRTDNLRRERWSPSRPTSSRAHSRPRWPLASARWVRHSTSSARSRGSRSPRSTWATRARRTAGCAAAPRRHAGSVAVRASGHRAKRRRRRAAAGDGRCRRGVGAWSARRARPRRAGRRGRRATARRARRVAAARMVAGDRGKARDLRVHAIRAAARVRRC